MMLLLYVLVGACFIVGCWKLAEYLVNRLYGAEFEAQVETIEVPSDEELMKLTKAKIEEVGREFGVELDKRKTKANMVKQFNDLLDK